MFHDFSFVIVLSQSSNMSILNIFCMKKGHQINDILFIIEGGNLAASNIRNLECSSYEVYLIDYGCGKFNKKVHIME